MPSLKTHLFWQYNRNGIKLEENYLWKELTSRHPPSKYLQDKSRYQADKNTKRQYFIALEAVIVCNSGG